MTVAVMTSPSNVLSDARLRTPLGIVLCLLSHGLRQPGQQG